MKLLRLVSFSLGFALICAFAIRTIGRHFEESAQDRKIDEVCAVVTEEVQTGSMAKALESARTLFSFTFPETPATVQVKEQNTFYGTAPASSESASYRESRCEIEARSDVAVLFFLERESVFSQSLLYWTLLLGILFSILSFGFTWMTKKIFVLAQRRFNLELQSALGFSTEITAGGHVSQFLESIVKGGGSGKNIRESVQNLKEKIIAQNREALALRETQLATEIELKKNEKFIEVVRQVRHDIRSPLQTLMVLSEKNTDSSVVHRQMGVVISSIHGMIEDLEIKEEMADTSGNGERLHIAEALIKEVIQQKRLLFDGSKIELKINSEFLSVVRVQPHHFRRVVGNLLQNAFDAFASDFQNKVIEVETEQVGKMLQVHIRDTGKGMSPEIQGKLFTSGFTFDKENGSGLGLSHAKSCILRWGGMIDLDSYLGKGTTVHFSLPIALSDARYIAKSPTTEATVNVVLDDDPEDFARVQRSLSGPSVYCSSITDFIDWQLATQEQKGVRFVFDYNLGENQSGLEVLKTVSSDFPRILSTNDYDREEVIEASQDGIYVLPKVFLV